MFCNLKADQPATYIAAAVAVAPAAKRSRDLYRPGSLWFVKVPRRRASKSPAQIDQSSVVVACEVMRHCDREVWSRIRLSEGRKGFLAT